MAGHKDHNEAFEKMGCDNPRMQLSARLGRHKPFMAAKVNDVTMETTVTSPLSDMFGLY